MEEKYGSPWLLCHRADLHNELRLLATQQDGVGKPVEVRLSASVDTMVGLSSTPHSLLPVRLLSATTNLRRVHCRTLRLDR